MTKKKNKEKEIPIALPSSKKVKPLPVKKSSPSVLKALWVVILVLLFIPIFNQLKNANNPDAKSKPPEKNGFALNRWFNSSFQKQAEDNLKQTWAFKDQLTKFNNDLDFELFHKCNVNGFVLGKENYIYSQGYIDAFFGRDYVGADSISKKLKMARALQDTLKKRNIDLVFVYAPDKASFFPEYLFSKYVIPHTRTNYEDYIKFSNQYGINYIDMNSWFLSMKGHSQYPLYPQYGHHWSFYGGCLAADSLIHYLAKLHHVEFPYFGWKDVQMSDEPQGRDDDILKKMNLSFNLPTYPLAYPDVLYDQRGSKNHTKVLGVGDSYYRDFLMNGTMKNVFDDGKYWYYYNKVYPESDYRLLEVWELDLKKEIESNQVIVVLGSDGFLGNFSWGFIEDAYQLYTNPKVFYARKQAEYKLNTYKKQIRADDRLLESVKNQAMNTNVPLDSVLNRIARNMMQADEKKN